MRQKYAIFLFVQNKSLYLPLVLKFKVMATITLNYDARNALAQKALDFILSMGLFQKKEKTTKLSRFEQSMLDIEQGNVFCINGSNKRLLEIMQKSSDEAKRNGFKPEMLEEILKDDDE